MEGSPNEAIARSREENLKEMFDSGAFFSVNKDTGNIEVIATEEQKVEAKKEMGIEFKTEELKDFLFNYIPDRMIVLNSPKFRTPLDSLKRRFPNLDPEDCIGQVNLGGDVGFVDISLKRYEDGVCVRVEKM